MKQAKRRIFAYHYAPGKKLFNIVVTLRDVPGALSSVLELLSDRVNLTGSVSYATGEGNAIWSGFAQALSRGESTANLKRLLRRSKMVKESWVEASEQGFLVDSFHTGIEVDSESFMLLPRKGTSQMFDIMVKTFGSGGETILFDEGTELGRFTANYFKNTLGPDLAKKKLSSYGSVFGAEGWGGSTLLRGGPRGRYKIRVKECFECSTKSEIRTTCNFRRGHIQGFLSTMLERPMTTVETSCRFSGAPYCIFESTEAANK
jgi:predicted hydrocarbon binding protein